MLRNADWAACCCRPGRDTLDGGGSLLGAVLACGWRARVALLPLVALDTDVIPEESPEENGIVLAGTGSVGRAALAATVERFCMSCLTSTAGDVTAAANKVTSARPTTTLQSERTLAVLQMSR